MSKTFKISLDRLLSSVEKSCWLEEQQLVQWIFFLNHFGSWSLFSPPSLPSRFAVLAFLHLGRDPPNLNVLGLPMFAAFWDGQLPQMPCPLVAVPRGGLCHSSA